MRIATCLEGEQDGIIGYQSAARNELCCLWLQFTKGQRKSHPTENSTIETGSRILLYLR